VTGDDDRDGVAPGGEADRPCGSQAAERLGERAVALSRRVGDGDEQGPDRLLEGCPFQGEGQVELGQGAGEVAGQLCLDLAEHAAAISGERGVARMTLALLEEAVHRLAVGDGGEKPDGAVEAGLGELGHGDAF
jgi:hypothetical protein